MLKRKEKSGDTGAEDNKKKPGFLELAKHLGNVSQADKKMLASEIAKDCPLLYTETIVKVDDRKEKV